MFIKLHPPIPLHVLDKGDGLAIGLIDYGPEHNLLWITAIDATGEMLRVQTAEIHKQAAGSTIPVETLQRAFQNIYQTMDSIDQFKVQALESMKTTVNTLSSEVEKSKGYIARAEGMAQIAGNPRAAEPLTPIAFAVAGQLVALHLALAEGRSPDVPRALRKVTVTR